jgi:hypothetical protein
LSAFQHRSDRLGPRGVGANAFISLAITAAGVMWIAKRTIAIIYRENLRDEPILLEVPQTKIGFAPKRYK